jgi:hypothetical protein
MVKPSSHATTAKKKGKSVAVKVTNAHKQKATLMQSHKRRVSNGSDSNQDTSSSNKAVRTYSCKKARRHIVAVEVREELLSQLVEVSSDGNEDKSSETEKSDSDEVRS